jgi:hypothetical protein
VQMTRRLSRPDGGFNGVIVASLDPTHLSRAYGSLALGVGGGFALLGDDDIVRSGSGIYANALGTGFRSGHLIDDSEAAESSAGLLREMLQGE